MTPPKDERDPFTVLAFLGSVLMFVVGFSMEDAKPGWVLIGASLLLLVDTQVGRVCRAIESLREEPVVITAASHMEETEDNVDLQAN